MRKILVVVDYQNDFVSGALGFEQAAALEQPIAQRVKQALDEGWNVVFTRDTHGAEYLDTREGKFLPVPHCMKESFGWNLYGSLYEYQKKVNEHVTFVDKPTFGSMELPGVIARMTGNEPEIIELCGVVTNICVVSNAIMLHSAFLEADIVINQSLCAAPNPADHENTLKLLSGMGYKII